MAITADGGKITQGLFEGLAEADADIFHSVVIINLNIAGGLQREVKKPCTVSRVSIWSKKGTPVLMSAFP